MKINYIWSNIKLMDNFDLMYPIGKFEAPDFITESYINTWKQTIEDTPVLLRQLVEPLNAHELSHKYRPNGWNINQVVHHMSDSHINAYIRFKLALTEDTPTIKPYEEGLWAKTAEVTVENIHYSLLMLEATHGKLSIILKNMHLSDFHKYSYYHPASHKNFTLGEVLGLYDWHSRHHLAHIKQALNFKDQF
jgi:hypothetical protein